MNSKEQSNPLISSDEREIEVKIEPRRKKDRKPTRDSHNRRSGQRHHSKESPNRMSLFGPYKTRPDTLTKKSTVINSSLYDPNNKEQRVLSSIELSAPKPASLESLPEAPWGRSSRKHRKHRQSSSNERHSRSREVISVPYTSQDDSLNLRQSGIFFPEGWKHRHSKSILRKPKSDSNLYPAESEQYVTLPLSICQNCLQTTCPRCRCTLSMSHESLNSKPRGGGAEFGREFYKPWAHPASLDNVSGRTGKFDRRNERVYRPFNSTSDVSDIYDNDTDKPIDHMEIEYTAEDNELSETNLDMEQQKLIVELAQEVYRQYKSLDNKARQMKLELDQLLGFQWHVVVGIDSFGSHLECLPGALMNFKVKQDVFLVWRT